MCVYEMPPGRDFVLDTLPEHPHVAVFTGAGHAAKFAGLIGQILADPATTGVTPHPIAPVAVGRAALTDDVAAPALSAAAADGICADSRAAHRT
jgi:glycine/D-amino acid oxidase-like deaminating enzyme